MIFSTGFMTKIFESDIENIAIELLEAQGYSYLTPEQCEQKRENFADVVLKSRQKNAIDTLTPKVPEHI